MLINFLNVIRFISVIVLIIKIINKNAIQADDMMVIKPIFLLNIKNTKKLKINMHIEEISWALGL